MTKELTRSLQTEIKIIFPDIWNSYYYNWFQDIENLAFREELRYSFDEVEERFHNENLFLLFILSGDKPEAFLLGYSYLFNTKKVFFLDTIAVKHQSQGIGKIILKYLFKWVKEEKYKGIYLYTEEVDEKNIPLRNFYEQLGFILEERDVKGNLSMILWF
jgi:GNAT superfamily N-acetyltransferase